jgi:hypothetical protein
MEDEALIKRQMEESRTALGDKLETLEHQVAHTVAGAAEAVTGTVDAVTDTVEAIKDTVVTVKDSVEGTMCAVKGTVEESVATVKDWLDIRGHFERCPWTMTGGAVGAGFLLGRFLSKPSASASTSSEDGHRHAEVPRNGNGFRHHAAPSAKSKRRHEHPTPSLLAGFEPELGQLKRLALGTLFGTLREMIVRAVPPEVGEKLASIVDNVTTKVGGQPMASVDWVGNDIPTSTGESHDHCDEAEMGGPLGSTHRQGEKTLGKFDRR